MPKLPQPLLEVAWKHTGEEGKLHYRMRRPDGSTCHLIAHEGETQCEVLEQHLAAIGYTGPKSDEDAGQEH